MEVKHWCALTALNSPNCLCWVGIWLILVKPILKRGNDSVPATVHPLQCSVLGNQVFLLSWVTNLTEFQSSVNPSIIFPISTSDACDRSPNLDTIVSLKLRTGCYGVSQPLSILTCWKCLSMSIGLVTWKWWLFQWWLQIQAFQSGRSKWPKKNCWKPPIGYWEEEAQHSGLLDDEKKTSEKLPSCFSHSCAFIVEVLFTSTPIATNPTQEPKLWSRNWWDLMAYTVTW